MPVYPVGSTTSASTACGHVPSVPVRTSSAAQDHVLYFPVFSTPGGVKNCDPLKIMNPEISTGSNELLALEKDLAVLY